MTRPSIADSLPTFRCTSGAELWRGVFGDDRPVEVEIGPGRGEFLLDAAGARAHPAHNFFAIERAPGRATRIRAALRAQGRTNARVIAGDAVCILELLPDRCVAAYHVLFPDPWWKRRHHRRRLFTETFVATIRRTLIPGGTISLVTDVEEYFQRAQRNLAQEAELQCVAAGPCPPPPTTFARKALDRGATLWGSLHRRTS